MDCPRSGLHGWHIIYERRLVCPVCRQSWPTAELDDYRTPVHMAAPRFDERTHRPDERHAVATI